MDTLGTNTYHPYDQRSIRCKAGLTCFAPVPAQPLWCWALWSAPARSNARAAMMLCSHHPLLSVVVRPLVIARPLYKTVRTRLDRVLGLTRENDRRARGACL